MTLAMLARLPMLQNTRMEAGPQNLPFGAGGGGAPKKPSTKANSAPHTPKLATSIQVPGEKPETKATQIRHPLITCITKMQL